MRDNRGATATSCADGSHVFEKAALRMMLRVRDLLGAQPWDLPPVRVSA